MGYGLCYVISFISMWGVSAGGYFSLTGAIVAFGIHPALDYFVGKKKPTGLFGQILFHAKIANFLLFLSAPFCFLFLIFSLKNFTIHTDAISIAGNILSTGVLLGVIAINTAHELVHRRQSWQRLLGLFNLTLVNFTWWKVAHVDLHHRHVSTPQDHASSKKNELVYAFWVRNFFHSLIESYQFKPTVCATYTGCNILFNLGVFYFFGFQIWIFSIIISILAIIMLLTVDFIEHYGLERKFLDSGRYEPVRHEHSWDCHYLLTNLTLFNLGYHSHHHWRASAQFDTLNLQSTAPEMKYGYSLMMLRSLIGKN